MQRKPIRTSFVSLGVMRTRRTGHCSPSDPVCKPTTHKRTDGFLRLQIVCVGLLAAMFVIFAARPVRGDAPIPFKYPFTDAKYPEEDVLISSVTIGPSKAKEGVGDPAFGELKAVLRVTIEKTEAYTWPQFLGLLKGENPDTDSAQCAVKWTPSGRDTNAKAQGARTDAATWYEDEDGSGFWETPMPLDATHVEVVVVYTDVLYYDNSSHRDDDTRAREWGDLPVVIASWSGDLQGDASWTFTKNLGDVFVRKLQYPTFAEIEACIQNATNVVNTKTGHTLYERPPGLHSIEITDKDAIDGVIDTAYAKGFINEKADTGFDILRD